MCSPCLTAYRDNGLSWERTVYQIAGDIGSSKVACDVGTEQKLIGFHS